MPRTSREVSSLSELHDGDHISFYRGVYYHHAIVIHASRDKMVIVSFTNPCETMVQNGMRSQPVRNPPLGKKGAHIAVETYDAEMFRQETVYVYDYDDCFGAKEVVEKAMSVQKGVVEWNEYDLISNNCEHFATWCKTGRKESKQVDVATNVGMGLAVAGGLSLLGSLVYKAFKEEPRKDSRHKSDTKSYYYQ